MDPIICGIGLSLIIFFFYAASSWSKYRHMKRENERLRGHLHTQMEINAEGNRVTYKENERLKKENANLRSSLATLKNRPDMAELQTLYKYVRAVELMSLRHPGFAVIWQTVLNEADLEMEKTTTGDIPWPKRVFQVPRRIQLPKLTLPTFFTKK